MKFNVTVFNKAGYSSALYCTLNAQYRIATLGFSNWHSFPKILNSVTDHNTGVNCSKKIAK